MTDIICAVQNYIPNVSTGISTQKTLSQVADLIQSQVVLFNHGDPNGFLSGTQYQLCWDITNSILYVCTTTGIAPSAVWMKSITLTAGTGISIAQSGNIIEISTSASGLSWTVVTATSATMVSDSGYIINNASLVTLSLPVSSDVGDIIKVLGQGAGGWSIVYGASQSIVVGDSTSTLTAGSLSSTQQHDSIELICTVANFTWQASVGPQGILTIV